MPLTWAGQVAEEQLWGTVAYFILRVVPIAEKAGVRLVLHPDDPQRSQRRGVAWLVTSVAAFQRGIDLADTPANAIQVAPHAPDAG